MNSKYYEFPQHLADYVFQNWDDYVAGDYIQPPLPSRSQLRYLFEVAYLASLEHEEGRPLQFTLCCMLDGSTENADEGNPHEFWIFDNERQFNIQEIRRLASATHYDTSAIWIRFNDHSDSSLSVRGLINLGTSWAQARNAFGYHYVPLPEALTIRALGPGQLFIYQGQYLIAGLQSGRLFRGTNNLVFEDLFGIDSLLHEGNDLLLEQIKVPDIESVREWMDFQWLAYINVVLATVNTIQLRGHGGALIFCSQKSDLIQAGLTRVKYRLAKGFYLQQSFIHFINLRNKFGDAIALAESNDVQHWPTEKEMQLMDYSVMEAERNLAETCSFVGNLAGVDGAIILGTDFGVKGFGTEILLDKVSENQVCQITGGLKMIKTEMDSEQFGTRHRSAMRLCGVAKDIAVFVVSQDGQVSLVWNDGSTVCFRKGIRTVNANMILS